MEHFSANGQPEAVERAVLHMDIASLDLNQVAFVLHATPQHTSKAILATANSSKSKHSHMQLELCMSMRIFSRL